MNQIKARINIKKHQSGFAVVEILLIVVILATVGGVGYYVVSQNKAKNSSASQSVTTAKRGTIGDVEAKNNQALNDEMKAEDSAANQETAAANAEISAAQSVGDGYETSF